jgi:hypothetical protein
MFVLPVVIQAAPLTRVHLNGAPWPEDRPLLDRSSVVRPSDGEIAGWRAPSADLSRP